MPRFLVMIALLVFATSGCAAAGSDLVKGPLGRSIAANVPGDEEAARIYRVLVGEFAGRRGQLDVALAQYVALAEDLDDPALAERAVQIGLFSKEYDAIVPAARRWVALAPDNREARRILGLVLIQAGQVGEAADLLTEWLGDGPDGAANTTEVAAVLQRADDKQTVIQVLLRMRKQSPDVAFVHHAFGVTALQLEDLDAALEGAEAALAVDGDWTQAWLLKVRVLEERGEAEQATRELAEAVERLPDHEILRLGYARLLVARHDHDRAREQVAILADGDPGNSELLYTVGVLSREMLDLDNADRYLRASLQAGGEKPELFFEIGYVAELRHEYSEALKWFAQVEGGDQALDAQVRTGYVLARMGQLEAAREIFQTVRRDNKSIELRLYLSESDAMRESGNVSEAMEVLNEALRAYPGDHDLLYARALTAERLDRLDLLERDLQTILAEEPDNAHALNALGYSLADRTDRYQEALGYIERALELSPDDAAIIDSMGWVLYRLGRYTDALSFLERAYRMNPDQEIAAHLGEVLWVNGDRERAIAIWEDGLRRVKEAPVVRRTMERFGI